MITDYNTHHLSGRCHLKDAIQKRILGHVISITTTEYCSAVFKSVNYYDNVVSFLRMFELFPLLSMGASLDRDEITLSVSTKSDYPVDCSIAQYTGPFLALDAEVLLKPEGLCISLVGERHKYILLWKTKRHFNLGDF